MQTTGTTHSPYYLGEPGDIAFKNFALAVQMTLGAAGTRLFTVDTTGLFDFFLKSFEDPIERQYHNCHCCKNFITRYGGLVTLDPRGTIQSAVWDVHQVIQKRAPDQYQRVTLQMKQLVESAKVVGQFFTRELVLGVPEAGGFSHFAVTRPMFEVAEPHLTAGQIMAVRKEDHKHLSIAIVEMKPELVSKAIAMLQAGGLSRPESLLPMGLFLQTTQELTRQAHGERRNRILWDAVGRAARGWCTPRGSAFGALVEDIAAGKTTEAITHAHNVRLDPLHYQRPQAAPSAGNIKEAERLFEKLDLAPALRRRPMALEEAELFWRPREVRRGHLNPGIFGHLQPKGSEPAHTGPLAGSVLAMTFAKFQRDILPQALEMRALVPYSGAFCGLTTATDPTAPPILQWDSLEKRNPGAWYLHAPIGYVQNWSLGQTWTDVLGLSKLPPDWYGNDRFHFKTTGRVLVILRGAADIRRQEGGWRGGLALFPECLKSELHSVRSTIEAFSNSKDLDEELRPRASGWLLSEGAALVLEVTTEQGKAKYNIDRLE